MSTLVALLLSALPTADEPLTLERLARMSRAELEALYRGAAPGAIPVGITRGRAIDPDSPLRSRAASVVWRGKFFDPEAGELVNRWRLGIQAVRAKVECGVSWFDGGPSIITDYQGMSRFIWRDVRDEIREVAPGLYLGMMFRRNSPNRGYEMFFALEAQR